MSVMVLAATMTSVSESSAKHRRGMAGVENYELSFEHVPDLSDLHLRCAGGRLYSPTRIRRRLVVYPGACVMRVAPVWTHTGTVQHAPFNADAGPRLAVHQQAARQYARGHRRRSSEHGWATHMSSLVHGPALRDGGLQVKNRPSANDCSVRCRNIAKK